MSNDNGHELQRLDEDHIKQVINEGGAVLVMLAQYRGQLYRCEKLVTGIELESYVMGPTELVRLHLREMVDGVDFDSTKDGPVIP